MGVVGYVHEAMANQQVRNFWRRVMLLEIVPTVEVPPSLGMTALQFLDVVERRFRNPNNQDALNRLATKGISRVF